MLPWLMECFAAGSFLFCIAMVAATILLAVLADLGRAVQASLCLAGGFAPFRLI